MESLISKDFLKLNKYTKQDKSLFELKKEIFNVLLKEEKNKSGVFLSHKHTDKELVYQLLTLFEKLNIKIYVDWLDDEMPEITNFETAIRIKNKIDGSKKFILLATADAINSKWCNWELGYGDARKYLDNIAILPITDSNNGLWTGNEYFKIYPAITIDKDRNELYVEFQNKKERFSDWLKK